MVSLLFFLFISEFNDKALIRLNAGGPVSLNRSTICAAVESHVPSGVWLRVPHHSFSSPRPRNVQCPRENLFAWFLTCKEFEIHFSEFPLCVHSMSWTLTWRWFDLQTFRAQCFDLAGLSGSSGGSPLTLVLGKYSTRTQSALHHFQTILFEIWTVIGN